MIDILMWALESVARPHGIRVTPRSKSDAFVFRKDLIVMYFIGHSSHSADSRRAIIVSCCQLMAL